MLAIPAAVALWLSRRRVYAAAMTVGTLGMVMAVLGWTSGGLLMWTVSAPLLLGGLSIGAVGFGVALGRSAVTVDSPGGISR